MAGNAIPQFCKNGTLGTPCEITAANTSSKGTGIIGTDIFKCFEAGVEGSLVEYVRFMPTATASNTTTATVARVFASSATSGAVTTANTHLLAEVSLPSVAVDNSVNPVYPVDVPLSVRIPAGWTILVTQHAAPVANTAWKVTAVAGDY